MKNILVSILLFGAALHAFADEAVKVHIKLSPAGSFVASTSDIKGAAVKNGTSFSAKNVVVNLKSLKTGIDLRDRHTQKHLETEKYPDAVLTEASGKDGKGTGKIKIHGQEKPISGTYEIQGKTLLAKFTVHLPDFDIKGIKYMSIGVKDDAEIEVTIPIQSAK